MNRILIAAAAALLLCGCGVTRSLEPPCSEEAVAVFPAELTGSWRIAEEASPGEPFAGELEITLSSADSAGRIADVQLRESGGAPWPPMLGALFECEEKRFMILFADGGALLKEGGYAETSGVLLQPVFLIFELAGGDAGWTAALITFVRREGDDYVPVSEDVRLHGGALVLNDSDEQYRMLSSGAYTVARRFTLTRAE